MISIAKKEMNFIKKRWIIPYNSIYKVSNWKAAAETFRLAYYKDKGCVPFYQNMRNWQLLNVMFFGGEKRITYKHLNGKKDDFTANEFYQGLVDRGGYYNDKLCNDYGKEMLKFCCHKDIWDEEVTKDPKLRAKYLKESVNAGRLESKYLYKTTFTKYYKEGLISNGYEEEILANSFVVSCTKTFYDQKGAWAYNYIQKHYKGKKLYFDPSKRIYINSIWE